jgi:GNAT superfamily N-acetyltransferase
LSELAGPQLLTADHHVDAFHSGDDALDGWLARRALKNQSERSSRTWVVTVESQVVAYYASSAAVVLRVHATGRAGRNQPDPLPAVLLARLAVDVRYQGRGLGAALVKHFVLKALEVADLVGVRVLLVHAKAAAAAVFYARFEFEPSPVDELTMMLLVKDITAGAEPLR